MGVYVVPFPSGVQVRISPKDVQGRFRICDGRLNFLVTVIVPEDVTRALQPGLEDNYMHARVYEVRPPEHVTLAFHDFQIYPDGIYLPDIYWRPQEVV